MAIQRSRAPDRTRYAVVTIILTVFALALGDAIIKGVSASFTLWQIFVLRSAVVLPILASLVRLRREEVSLVPKHVGWTSLRSVMLTAMWITYYASLPHVNLSVAAASYYTLPLFITMFAALFLDDKIGKGGWLAIGLGFIGVLLVLRPRVEAFNWFALLPVSSAILYALAMILTRSHCKVENVFVLSLWLNLSMLLVGAAVTLVLALVQQGSQPAPSNEFLVGPWSEMGAKEWTAIGVLSIAIFVGSVGAAYAYQNGPSATIATFDFAYVAFAVIWGLVLFQEVPSAIGAAGMFLIVVAGILAVHTQAAGNAAEQGAEFGR